MVHPSSSRMIPLAAGAALFLAGAAWTESVMEPSASSLGTVGLGQVMSAEAMGPGRMTFQLRANLYQQDKDFPGAPPKDAQITTTTAALAFGLSPYLDVYASLAGYNLGGMDSGNGGGLGTGMLGIQSSLALSPTIPFRIGIQIATLAGMSKDQINDNGADGYNYLETRTGTDFMARLTQTATFAGESMVLKIHFNEGWVSSLQANRSAVLIQGAGVELSPHPALILGTEFGSRSILKDAKTTDPMWITPSLTFRSQAHLNAQVGADLALSGSRDGTPDRALEPWRLFGSLTFSTDLLAGKRREALEKARRDSLERLALSEQARRSQAMADSLARKAREDSLAMAARYGADRLVADSLARKAREDSLLLAEARRKLEEERAKRSDWEKEFLRTGVLNLEALYFETGKAVISINSKPYLNLVGKVLSKYAKLQMEIGGHTDNTGNASANMKLSQNRAEAVRLYLTALYPELSGHLAAQGYGQTMPKEGNTTAEGRQINRRVEIKVLNKDVLKEYE
jgi:outer membrane protein OmpA-like peptidoglycan-associated protein